jgi:DNA invertase Pin-like site-specific DNA recombinase
MEVTMKTSENSPRTKQLRRAVCYYRCASADQSDQQRALEDQRATCHAVAAEHVLHVIDEFADIGESGTNRFRLGLADLLAAVRANAPVTVIVADTARLARDHASLAWAVSEIEKTGSTILPATGSVESGLFADAVTTRLLDYAENQEQP